MRVEGIDIDALIGLTKQTVYTLKQTIDNELSNDSEFKDDLKPAVKEMLVSLAHDNICNQVQYILGIQSGEYFEGMRERLDNKVHELVYGDINIDDLIKFIQNLYIELLTIESNKLSDRYSSVMERKTIMIGRQCIGH
jgi:hypothetical protein